MITVGGEPRGTVELDHCPRGHGLWLDAGEMRAIIRTFASDEADEEGEISRFLQDMFRHELEAEGKGDSA